MRINWDEVGRVKRLVVSQADMVSVGNSSWGHNRAELLQLGNGPGVENLSSAVKESATEACPPPQPKQLHSTRV